MSKTSSRISKIEDALKTKETEEIFINIVSWHEANSKHFIDNEDKKRYKEWRINCIREDSKKAGQEQTLVCFWFDENDVEKHIVEFREYQKSLTKK